MKNWAADLPDGSGLPSAIDQFFSLLESRNIEYLLVGGIALLNYIEGRNTQDIGFILAQPDLSQLPEISLTEETEILFEDCSGNFKLIFC